MNGNDEVGNMCLYGPKDGSLRRLTLTRMLIMNNGRIMYTRWGVYGFDSLFLRFVMHMNPDGTEQSLCMVVVLLPEQYVRCQTAARWFITVYRCDFRSSWCDTFRRLMLFDPSKSRKSEKGMLQELPFRDRKIEPIVKRPFGGWRMASVYQALSIDG